MIPPTCEWCGKGLHVCACDVRAMCRLDAERDTVKAIVAFLREAFAAHDAAHAIERGEWRK